MVRFKNRYITVEVDAAKKPKEWVFNDKSLYKAVREAVKKFHGDFGCGVAEEGLRVKYCNRETKVGIIRCRRGVHKLVASVLPLIDSVNGINVQVNTLYTGATLKHCYKFIKAYQEEYLRNCQVNFENEKEMEKFKKKVMVIYKMYDGDITSSTTHKENKKNSSEAMSDDDDENDGYDFDDLGN